MIKKLVVVLLTGVICLIGVTSALAVTYNEAPMLRTLVAAGELPPVEERLPDEPLVLEPVEDGEIGQYGGTLYTAGINPGVDVDLLGFNNSASMLKYSSQDYATLIPNVAKDWEFSEDGKTLTLYLRKGIKWSDGVPFTADDIMFWYESVFSNDELTPVKPIDWSPGGESMKMEKIGDYTVRLHFAAANPFALNFLATQSGTIAYFYLPKHYMKKYHPNYVPEEELQKMAEDEGLETWWQLFKSKNPYFVWEPKKTVNAPTLEPYVKIEEERNIRIFERNPYYWKVDREGNQLPYIDRIHSITGIDPQTKVMKVISGELDFATGYLSMSNWPVLSENAEKGGYRMIPIGLTFAAHPAFFLNLTHKDPVLRKIFQNKRFRQAISLSIDREEINDVTCLGLALPIQASIHPKSLFYKEEYAQAYAQYDTGKASDLLDEMGLKWDENHQYRLRPDGKTLSIIIDLGHAFWVPHTELIREYMEAIGIKTSIKLESSALMHARRAGNEIDMVVYQTWGREIDLYMNTGRFFELRFIAPLWDIWHTSDGEQGEEPPEEIKRILNLMETLKTTMNKEERGVALDELLRSQAENIWIIGAVAFDSECGIVKQNLYNIPSAGWAVSVESANPEVWFYKN